MAPRGVRKFAWYRKFCVLESPPTPIPTPNLFFGLGEALDVVNGMLPGTEEVQLASPRSAVDPADPGNGHGAAPPLHTERNAPFHPGLIFWGSVAENLRVRGADLGYFP